MGSLTFGKEVVNRHVWEPGCVRRRGHCRPAISGGTFGVQTIKCSTVPASLVHCSLCWCPHLSAREQELCKSQLPALFPRPELNYLKGVYINVYNCWNWSPGVEHCFSGSVGSSLKTGVLVFCVMSYGCFKVVRIYVLIKQFALSSFIPVKINWTKLLPIHYSKMISKVTCKETHQLNSYFAAVLPINF